MTLPVGIVVGVEVGVAVIKPKNSQNFETFNNVYQVLRNKMFSTE